MMKVSRVFASQSRDRSDDLGEDITFAKDLDLGAVDLDVHASELAVENLVANDNGHRNPVTTLEQSAGANGDDGAALRFFLSSIGQYDPTRGGFLGTERLDNDSIVQRIQVHLSSLPGCSSAYSLLLLLIDG